ncbi:MAG: hypothetical protein IT174_00990 [Acidobacteria bacterium]|nr:hypothetical protein [Acidobacteriota bacterium]
MRRIRSHYLLAIVTLFASAAFGQIAPRANDPAVRNLLARLETKTDTFRTTLDRRMDNTKWNNTNTEDNVASYLAAFENATDELRNDVTGRRATAAQATEVLNYGWYLDDFMRRNRLGSSAERQWRGIRTDLNTLARYYNVNWSWNRTMPPFPTGRFPGNSRAGLTGTYRIMPGMSDNLDSVIDRALNDYGQNERTRLRRNLERRLSAADVLAIDRNGRNVTIGSSLSPRMTILADGRVRTETNDRGRTMRTTATLTRDGLTVNMDGDRARDFWVSFETVGNDRLRVTKRIYLENRNQAVTATSVYNRTADVARWPAVNGWPNNSSNAGNFYIPNGTRITAVLQNDLSTKESKDGDPFTLRVTSPSQYRGAVIHGNVAQADDSGRLTGRAELSLDFDTIVVNGRSYRFAGIVDSAAQADGDTIKVNNEGTIREDSQTKETLTRGGIGAALGAIIGAIAGGGEGAAIGAGIGAGAGVGSIVLQGKDDLELEQGSQFTITATSPARGRS